MCMTTQVPCMLTSFSWWKVGRHTFHKHDFYRDWCLARGGTGQESMYKNVVKDSIKVSVVMYANSRSQLFQNWHCVERVHDCWGESNQPVNLDAGTVSWLGKLNGATNQPTSSTEWGPRACSSHTPHAHNEPNPVSSTRKVHQLPNKQMTVSAGKLIRITCKKFVSAITVCVSKAGSYWKIIKSKSGKGGIA